MKALLTSIFLFLLSLPTAQAQIGRIPLSPLQKIEQTIGRTDISIVYCRPSKRERKIFGELVPYNEMWRTGANRNTTIEFSKDILIQDQRLKKGKYAIFTKPNQDKWDIYFYTDTDNWDVPEKIDPQKIALTASVPVSQISEVAQNLSITIGDFTNYAFDLVIQWDKTKVNIPIDLTTHEYMDKLINDELTGPQAGDFYSASVYQLESGKDFKQGLAWIDEAIQKRAKKVWYDYRVKALLLIELNKFEEAKTSMSKGLTLAKAIDNQYGLSEFERINNILNEAKK